MSRKIICILLSGILLMGSGACGGIKSNPSDESYKSELTTLDQTCSDPLILKLESAASGYGLESTRNAEEFDVNSKVSNSKIYLTCKGGSASDLYYRYYKNIRDEHENDVLEAAAVKWNDYGPKDKRKEDWSKCDAYVFVFENEEKAKRVYDVIRVNITKNYASKNIIREEGYTLSSIPTFPMYEDGYPDYSYCNDDGVYISDNRIVCMHFETAVGYDNKFEEFICEKMGLVPPSVIRDNKNA
ncbi:MAG: hypothetical protein J5715_09145 [Clostridiales bacterium]|nr:hypothetical protein [Clostridiales bacterium]